MPDVRVLRPRRDRISNLPDDLLHIILLRLRDTAAAARTSVLSRRWRRVWAHVRGFSFHLDRGGDLPQRTSALRLRGIGAVLSGHAHAAPTLDRLEISVDRPQISDGATLVNPWLRSAAPRLAGELRVRAGEPWMDVYDLASGIELPACEHATAIDLQLPHLRLRLAPTGTFAALRVLRIDCRNLHGGDLERALSTQCPRLQELTLMLTSLTAAGDRALSIRSDSLERLKLGGHVADGEITVDAPRLVCLEMSRSSPYPWLMMKYGAHIAAPELGEVIWHNSYSSRCDHILETRRHLRRLEVVPSHDDQLNALVPATASALLERFDFVEELELHIRIPFAMDGWKNSRYQGFAVNVPNLPRCNVLKLHLQAEALGSKQPFVTIMMNLLQKCVGLKKLYVCLMSNSFNDWHWEQEEFRCGQLTTNAIALDSLEEIEITSLKVKDGEAGLVRLLLTSFRAVPRRVVVHATHRTSYLRRSTCEWIAGCCHPETRLEFYRYLAGGYGLMWAGSGRS